MRALIAFALAVSSAGCAIRYDASGVTRVGVGLWGFGDPPGVNWNLDGPRRDVPELPAPTRPELPPRSTPPDWRSDDLHSSRPTAEDGGIAGPIVDNRDCASQRLPEVASSMAVRAVDCRLVTDRR